MMPPGSAPAPADAAPASGALHRSLTGLPLSKILRILGGGLWRARTNPLELTDWIWGDHLGGDSRSPFAANSGLGTRHDLLGSIYPPDRPVFDQALRTFLEGGATDRIDFRIIVGNGELLWVRQWLLDRQETSDPDRQLVTGLVRVVSEEKRLQWEIMRTSENERSRIGQEIHDDVCQILAGINYLVHVLHQRLQDARPAEAAELEQLNQEIQAGLERTRALAHGLLPAKSDFNTLSQALRDLSRQVATRFGIELDVTLPPHPPAFSRERLLHLYRIVQEAASNSFKHGRATRIVVTLEQHDGWNVLSIEDNGPGLPADSSRVEGVGLNVMRNRAELLGGWLEIGNSRRGARVQVHLPPGQET